MAGEVPQIEVGRPDGLVEVHLLGLPVAVHQLATEHSDELRREFTLLSVQQADVATPDVPARLLDLIDRLGQEFSGFTKTTTVQLEEAIDEGREHVDLVFRVPPQVKDAVQQLGAMLDEADAYCRSGGSLLTLATPAEAVAYRRWYLDQFIQQADGAAPTPWPGS